MCFIFSFVFLVVALSREERLLFENVLSMFIIAVCFEKFLSESEPEGIVETPEREKEESNNE